MNTSTSSPLSDRSTEASDLRMATFRLARRLRAERAIDSMSDGQFIVLATLKIHGPLTLGELAERERVTAPSMNRTVNSLEAAGFVGRSPDESDRRKVWIAVTDTGRDVVEETIRRRDAWLESVLAELTAAERTALARGAEVMRKIAER